MILNGTIINCLFFFTWWHIIRITTRASFIDNVHVCVIIIVITLGEGGPTISTKPLLGGVSVVFFSTYTVRKNIVVRRLYKTMVFHRHTRGTNNLEKQDKFFPLFNLFLILTVFHCTRGRNVYAVFSKKAVLLSALVRCS